MPTVAWGDRRYAAGPARSDEVLVADGAVSHRQLEHAVEEHPAAT